MEMLWDQRDNVCQKGKAVNLKFTKLGWLVSLNGSRLTAWIDKHQKSLDEICIDKSLMSLSILGISDKI
jgi:hypothetical protein